MPSAGQLDDAHAAAIERAYDLIGLAQGQNVDAEIGAAEAEGAARGWTDVRLLLKWARTMAARESGSDNSAYLQAMHDLAESTGETSLLALALATAAARRSKLERALDVTESTATPLVRAVALLDEESGPVIHRAAALIEVGVAAQDRGFWELAVEYYDRAERYLDGADDPRLAATVRLQRRVLSYNRAEVVLDWASAQAMIGGWDSAALNAAGALPCGYDAIDGDWPASWEMEHRAHLHLLTALAGMRPSDFARRREEASTGVSRAAVVALGEAIGAARAADTAGAARLAMDLADRLGWATPQGTRLLCMSIAARQPGTPAAVAAYADELALLRWNARLDQATGLRDAIDVERQRRDHEQLRRQVLVDELTGLANRRGYRAYLNARLNPGAASEEPREYAVMMVDVDHFKRVNDRFGHDVGDLVLARISQVLSAQVRPVDLAARLGGDEFVVVLAGVGPDHPEKRAQEIIDTVREQAWDEVAPGLTVSISIGVHRGGVQELPTLLTDADRNLYHAKNTGRGRIAATRR
ncbi:GGDEF domain-containing protein [Actinoplanes sp. NPDC089786]|uniref:GGDEF domain-containing protein n=1 Tax=Actinoplanes sp. NPDC089786 TaxID=3155185 RepID=UPI0034205875